VSGHPHALNESLEDSLVNRHLIEKVGKRFAIIVLVVHLVLPSYPGIIVLGYTMSIEEARLPREK
jgi:hypothetical protein